MTRHVALVACTLLACKGEPAPIPHATTAPPASDTPPTAVVPVPLEPEQGVPSATAPAPGDLDVCRAGVDQEPLAALCTLGQPGAKAVYDCKNPQPIMICRGASEWTCFYNVPGGEVVPPLQFSAYVASDAPVPKSGEIIDTSSMKRDGEVLGIEVKWVEPDTARGSEKARLLREQLTQWGCVMVDEYRGSFDFECGTWTARVSYYDKQNVRFTAQLRNRYSC